MRFVMNPDMVYQYPIWLVGLLVVSAAMFGAVLIELCVRRLLTNELRQRHNDVAAAMWFVLIVGGALTVAFGSFLGAPSLGMQLAMSAVLAASGALVLILIVALSNPFRGSFRVSTAPFDQVLSLMQATAGQQ